MSDLSGLAELLSLLRTHAVKSYKADADGDAIELEFYPPSEKTEDLEKTTTPDTELCRCGHPEHAHQGGLCIFGCEVEHCAPPEPAEAKEAH